MKNLHLIFLAATLTISTTSFTQSKTVSISGQLKNSKTEEVIPFAKIVLSNSIDKSFAAGTISQDNGEFVFEKVTPGNYYLQISTYGYQPLYKTQFVGDLSPFIDLSVIQLQAIEQDIEEVVVVGQQDEVIGTMDKKVFSIADNLGQTGGSAMQIMQNLPGITIQDGKVQMRGNPNVIILIDGKQSGLTGFGNQSGLDNIPSSSIERIEIINNPSAKYDSNGSAGIINIILKKETKNGLNGKIGLIGGLGAIMMKKENLPTISSQYQYTPKINPSLSLNYRKNKVNLFMQADYLYTQTLNKNEFVTRTYDDGTIVQQQTKRNRNTGFLTARAGADIYLNDKNTFTLSGMYGREKIIDHGEQPFFSSSLDDRLHLWKFTEDEVKTTIASLAQYKHLFKNPGHELNAGVNYTFHREDEQYYFQNIYPSFTGLDTFKLISDEQVFDATVDYIKPLKHGRFEGGVKFRYRIIPTNMLFIPGINSPLDSNAGGWADYQEIIPALYGNYIYQSKKFEAELGLRAEYVTVNYKVNPSHPVYKSDGYSYIQPFPTVRFGYRINDKNKLSVFYNRRVNRPNEVDIRIFPKYDDAEIIKVGNPALSPQFTDAFELAYKTNLKNGYFFLSAYHRITNGTISRIAISDTSKLIYSVFQNAGKSSNTGLEFVFSKDFTKWLSLNINGNVYYNQINSFTVNNSYPVQTSFVIDKQTVYSGNLKLNTAFHLKYKIDAQLTAIYLAPDIIPQGKIDSRFTLDIGVKKGIQKGKGELFLNATDILNTMNVRQTVTGSDFSYTSKNYYETQVVRVGYSYKF
jgi:outer membrane receptor protein involved in Fe transport